MGLMILEVTSDTPNSYQGKSGPVNEQILACVDKDPSGHRLNHTLVYHMSPEEKLRFAGKLLDRKITVGVTKMDTWNGNRRIWGSIVDVPGLDQVPPVKTTGNGNSASK